jgi:hypothetical protein
MITRDTYSNISQLHTQYKAIGRKEAETRMKYGTNHTCGNSQMVASHLTKGRPQQSLCLEAATFPNIHPH